MAVDIVSECKARLGVTGSYHDATIRAYADDVTAFLVAAGVPEDVAASEDAVGCIARGVADLWQYGSGEAKFSQAFVQRAIQLAAAGRQEE